MQRDEDKSEKPVTKNQKEAVYNHLLEQISQEVPK